MKIKHKGKVFPSPSSSPPPCDGDQLSLLLPATILALASVLSLEDREVLAYMITRSVMTLTTASTSSVSDYSRKKTSRKQGGGSNSGAAAHKPPLFDCDCFDCYTSYWYRWDSSPNRELIHQVIEAFEEHLPSRELSNKHGGRRKRKEKPDQREKSKTTSGQPEIMARMEKLDRREKSKAASGQPEIMAASKSPLPEPETAKKVDGILSPRVVSPEKDVAPLMTSPENRQESPPMTAAETSHKGLARKVLPDVMGLLNCRLWNLWNPTV